MTQANRKAWIGLGILAVVAGLLLFVPAGTIRYWQAWVYLAIFLGASTLHTLYLMKNDPALLERRLRGGPAAEKEISQKIIMLFTSAGFVALLAVSAIDHRHTGTCVPLPVVVAGDIAVALGYYLIYLVFKVNTFTASTVEVTADQKVVSTGPYAVVRHPMYAGGLLYLLGTPIALGSYRGLLVFAAIIPFLIWRLIDEERLLRKELQGYAEYSAKVRWRLIPGVF